VCEFIFQIGAVVAGSGVWWWLLFRARPDGHGGVQGVPYLLNLLHGAYMRVDSVESGEGLRVQEAEGGRQCCRGGCLWCRCCCLKMNLLSGPDNAAAMGHMRTSFCGSDRGASPSRCKESAQLCRPSNR
jgi:hypothetical protein